MLFLHPQISSIIAFLLLCLLYPLYLYFLVFHNLSWNASVQSSLSALPPLKHVSHARSSARAARVH